MEMILIAKHSIAFFIFRENMNIFFYSIMISSHNKKERERTKSLSYIFLELPRYLKHFARLSEIKLIRSMY